MRRTNKEGELSTSNPSRSVVIVVLVIIALLLFAAYMILRPHLISMTSSQILRSVKNFDGHQTGPHPTKIPGNVVVPREGQFEWSIDSAESASPIGIYIDNYPLKGIFLDLVTIYRARTVDSRGFTSEEEGRILAAAALALRNDGGRSLRMQMCIASLESPDQVYIDVNVIAIILNVLLIAAVLSIPIVVLCLLVLRLRRSSTSSSGLGELSMRQRCS